MGLTLGLDVVIYPEFSRLERVPGEIVSGSEPGRFTEQLSCRGRFSNRDEYVLSAVVFPDTGDLEIEYLGRRINGDRSDLFG